MDSLLAAPRDPLLFLYPRFYTSSAIEATQETVPSDHASTTPPVSVDHFFQQPSQEGERCDDPPKEGAPKRTHAPNAIVPMKVVSTEPGRPIDHNSSELVANHELDPLTADRLRKTLKVEDASNARRVLTVAHGRQKHKLGKAFVKTRLKKKGSWSYDWRVPFGLLQQHYQRDSVGLGGEKTQRFRGVISNQQRPEDRPRFSETHTDRIPRPDIWSPLTFLSYVEDLTSSSVSRVMHQHIYGACESHVATISRKLEELFTDPLLKDSLTARAFDTACAFLVKYGFIPTTRVVFSQLDKLGLSINAATFNAILRGAASHKDLHNYTFFLQAMVRRGVKPNGETWITLLMAIHPKAVKLLILRAMGERGVLDQTSTLKDAVNQIVRDEVAAHFDTAHELTAFLDFMDRRYGSDWPSVSACNRILDELGERGLLLQCFDMLGFMKQRRIKPNSVALNTLLTHCSKQRNMDGAIQVLRTFESSFDIFLVENHFHQLFMLTWKKQLLNCCRVVWRYACMAAAVSYPTQKLVKDSLARPILSQRKSMADAWRCTVGKCIVGVGRGDGDGDDVGRLRTVQRLVAIAEAATKPYEDPDFVKLTKQLSSGDLVAAKQYRPKSGLAEKLEEALAMDRRWVREGIWKDSSTMWKVENGIDVPVAGFRGGKQSNSRRLRVSGACSVNLC